MRRVHAAEETIRTSWWLTELRSHMLSEEALLQRRDGAALYMQRFSGPQELPWSFPLIRMALSDILFTTKDALKDPAASEIQTSPLQFAFDMLPTYRLLPTGEADKKIIAAVNTSPAIEVEYIGERIKSLPRLAGAAALALDHVAGITNRPQYVVGYTYLEMARVASRLLGFQIANYDMSTVPSDERQDVKVGFSIFADLNPRKDGQDRQFIPKAIYGNTEDLLSRWRAMAQTR